ncbi:ATP-binding cassette domain-containing protein [Millisia brevis]|uniref:ATP-binding cassette domain-containing protein n=1 Tax=Millisia brevis TaxID=264148 RepID=UPI0008313950|nr:ATP-binding cassette domain-containing protein [Millisia brevis]
MSETDLAIDAVGLTRRYGRTVAVDRIDLAVPVGGVYAVLGTNGAGKTTTVRMLATLERPDGGRARIFGHDVVSSAGAVRSLIGVTGQYASLDEDLTAEENLLIFARLVGASRRAARRRAADLLDEFGLSDAARRTVRGFSGGMRRRLDLAASLITRPRLLFLDEPTTGLDPRTRAQMWNTLREMVATGSTVLLTTQYLDEADELADRVAVMDRGHVVAEGTVDDLKSAVGDSSVTITPLDRDQCAAAAAVCSALSPAQATVDDDGRTVVIPMSNLDGLAELLAALRDRHIPLAAVNVARPTLDDVFFRLTEPSTHDRTNASAIRPTLPSAS